MPSSQRDPTPNLLNLSSDDDREGSNDDMKRGERRHDGASWRPTSSTSEPASETLLTPLRAQYHKCTMESPGAKTVVLAPAFT
jgi:hypothetical protein